MARQNDAAWQIVLQKIIQPPKERQRLAVALGVNTITLTRWAKNDSRPQRTHLLRLVKVVQPQFRDELLEALQDAFPDMQEKLVEETNESLSSPFFRQVLRDRATTTETMGSWQISAAILDEGLKLLDPNTLGMAITPVLCMPPVLESNGQARIRSLREQGGRGTPPWEADLEHMSIFLGMNSLAGYVVQKNQPASVRDVKEERFIPIFSFPAEIEASAAACPIWLEGKVAGCLLAASRQLDHFTQTRMDLLIQITNLYSLALPSSAYYDHNLIQLRYIPHPKHQQKLLKEFRQRTTRHMITSGQLSNAQAELMAWQGIEEELLKLGQILDLDEDETEQPFSE